MIRKMAGIPTVLFQLLVSARRLRRVAEIALASSFAFIALASAGAAAQSTAVESFWTRQDATVATPPLQLAAVSFPTLRRSRKLDLNLICPPGEPEASPCARFSPASEVDLSVAVTEPASPCPSRGYSSSAATSFFAAYRDGCIPASLLLASFPGAAPPEPNAGGGSATADELTFTIAPETPPKPPSVQWGRLMRSSLFYVGVMHSYRFAREPATRHGMTNDPLGYFAALGAMHGWSDGDGYYENYLGHPIQGAVSNYIWIHNDPRYRTVEFGNTRDYWMSRFRAYVYAWAFSEQFEVGPLSEASLGQIQRYCCAYGFVDHVITPNAGMVWLIGGDILDKYVTRPIENRTHNMWVRMAARTVLNFPEGFANMMSFETPWYRENRPGAKAYDGELYFHQPVLTDPSALPTIPKIELTGAVPSFTQMGGYTCIGGSGVAAFKVSDNWQWTAEVGGCTLGNSLPRYWSGDSLVFNTGPQWIMHGSSRWMPHVALRAGGQKITQEYCQVKGQKPPGLVAGTPCESEPTKRAQHYESTGFSLTAGAGVDYRLNAVLALRVANLDYMQSWLHPVAGTDYNQGLRFTTGVVLRVGTW